MGRGLRLHPDKAQLTVLDFIAPQARQFRFAERFRAFSLGTPSERPRIDTEIEQGFGWLPSGCLVRLSRKAQQCVLDSIRAQLGLNRPALERELRGLMDRLGRRPVLEEMLDHLVWDGPEDLLAKALPSELLGLTRADQRASMPGASGLGLGLRQLAEVDDPDLLDALIHLLERPVGEVPTDPEMAALALSLLWGKPRATLQSVLDALRENRHWCEDVRDLGTWRRGHLLRPPARRFPHLTGPLRLHARYTREQVLIALGKWRFEDTGLSNTGVEHVPQRQVDAFFVTIDKDAKRFSPQTMYEDYALNAQQFHWQSQSTTGVDSRTGQRYLRHAELGYTPLLFLRRSNEKRRGLTEPYCYLGPLEYLRHSGSRPISIVWRLLHPMPPPVLDLAQRHAL